MRALLDTNIVIDRENNTILDKKCQDLFRIAQDNKINLLIHPLTIKEIEKDTNQERRKISLSKISSYSQLESPKILSDISQFPELGSLKGKDKIDDNLLYCIKRNAVNLLITEDKGLLSKASRIGIDDKVMNIIEANRYFNNLFYSYVATPIHLQEVPLSTLNFDDTFFDSLKSSYPEFKDWWEKISKEGRKGFVHQLSDGTIASLLVIKEENEPIDDSTPAIKKAKRLKICTLKVNDTGKKIGELFLRIAIDYAVEKNIPEIYLTHFIEDNDRLVSLIKSIGFIEKSKKASTGEPIFIKYLELTKEFSTRKDISRYLFPTYYDGPEVNKYIVPIKPEYHDRLFVGKHDRQLALAEYSNSIVEQNTVKKAYICNSRITGLQEGDIILFYCSDTLKALTSIGVIQEVYTNQDEATEIANKVGKRTVYSLSELEELARKKALVLLFRHHFYFNKPMDLKLLRDSSLLKAAPQSIMKIDHQKYLEIKNKAQIYERFTVDKT
ncbi:hypothetical protein IPM65_02450 [Candidatus Roizmanbacteria bacterium]|nr:MAG: hypothetical protein IPM65_02450 [Candidatus Roizmanbacteria bacterium]